MFPSLCGVCANDGERIRDTVHSHLGALIQKFHEYFPDIRGKIYIFGSIIIIILYMLNTLIS